MEHPCLSFLGGGELSGRQNQPDALAGRDRDGGCVARAAMNIPTTVTANVTARLLVWQSERKEDSILDSPPGSDLAGRCRLQ